MALFSSTCRLFFCPDDTLVLGLDTFQKEPCSVRGKAAAAARSLQSCPPPCDPTDGSLPGSPSLGFSRREHWSGLPFPSPVHESEK